MPLFSKGKLVGFAMVLDDPFTANVLRRARWCPHCVERYPMGMVNGRLIHLHKIVFAHYHKDAVQSEDVDHEDGNRWNALPENLRHVTRSVNIANSGKRVTNKSGFKGVSWDRGRWVAHVMVNYKGMNLGRYHTKEEAARAVNAAYRKYFPTVRIPNPEVET